MDLIGSDCATIIYKYAHNLDMIDIMADIDKLRDINWIYQASLKQSLLRHKIGYRFKSHYDYIVYTSIYVQRMIDRGDDIQYIHRYGYDFYGFDKKSYIFKNKPDKYIREVANGINEVLTNGTNHHGYHRRSAFNRNKFVDKLYGKK